MSQFHSVLEFEFRHVACLVGLAGLGTDVQFQRNRPGADQAQPRQAEDRWRVAGLLVRSSA